MAHKGCFIIVIVIGKLDEADHEEASKPRTLKQSLDLV
jgi:hypothetical protein